MTYIPKEFEETNLEEIIQIIKNFPMATLVSNNEEYPEITHLPIHIISRNIENEIPELFGHFALQNNHWKSLLKNNDAALIFKGSDGYISPSWYSKPNVPTWNYEAVHLYGKVELLDLNRTRVLMSDLVKHFEHKYADNPLLMEHLSPEYIEENLNGIKAFVFKTQKTKAIKKMSQNKSDDYLQNVWPALEKDENGRILAEKMKKARKN